MKELAQLLRAIYEAQLASICASRVQAMDETQIKAGRAGPGKMNAAYFWPIYGEHDEVCFPFFDSRRHENVEKALGLNAQKPRSSARRKNAAWMHSLVKLRMFGTSSLVSLASEADCEVITISEDDKPK